MGVSDKVRRLLQQILDHQLAARVHLVEASIEESVHLWLVKGQLLDLSPVVQTEVHQVFAGSCGKHTAGVTDASGQTQ